MKGAKPLMLLSATLLTISALAQQGVFYYVNTNAELINSKTADAVLNENGMVILNECSDAKYENPAVQLIELNKSFIKTSENIVKVNNLNSVSSITKYSNGNYGVFANVGDSPVKLNVSGSYKELEQNPVADQKNESVVGRAVVGKQILVVSTKSETKGEYAIVLSSFSSETGEKEWSKAVSSETNESADAIVADNEGNVVVLGRKYNDNGTEYIPIFYKLDAKGGIVWKKSSVDMPSNFYSQNLAISKNNEIFYACGLTQRSGLQTKLYRLDANGNTKRSISIIEFTGNGVLSLSSGKILLYGSRFYTDVKQVVTKGAYVILDSDLNELSNKSLGVNDKPDSDFKYSTTSSSDLQTAVELESGSIVMVGKVTMPQAGGAEKQNNTIVVVADAYGNYK